LKTIPTKLISYEKQILQQHSYNYLEYKIKKNKKTNIMKKKTQKKKKKEKSYLNLIVKKAEKRKEKINS
jgi:hypothetical protein